MAQSVRNMISSNNKFINKAQKTVAANKESNKRWKQVLKSRKTME